MNGRVALSQPLGSWDVVVVGAGAAGLATAIFAARRGPQRRILCLDGATRVGAKILVSGGSRCNVTNRVVTERDFWGGSPQFVRNVLRAFPAERAVRFFEELGVSLHEEEDGKLFPDSNRARTVLDALLAELQRLRVELRTSARVVALSRSDAGFTLALAGGDVLTARRVVLATGGRSLPKSGSDGGGYELATSLGHSLVETTPALAPLVLAGDAHRPLAGRAHPAALTLRVDGRVVIALTGALLWTHFGISGPVALNLSRHWHRAQLASRAGAAGDASRIMVSVNVLPGETLESLDAWLQQQALERPRSQVATVLAARLPAAVADRWVADAGIGPDQTMAHLSREERRRLSRAVVDTPLVVTDSRGYTYAEITAGGIPLDEVDHRSMGSRLVPGLYLVGEVLDVDGRLGGFNFQWAWSSAWVAAQAMGRATAGPASA